MVADRIGGIESSRTLPLRARGHAAIRSLIPSEIKQKRDSYKDDLFIVIKVLCAVTGILILRNRDTDAISQADTKKIEGMLPHGRRLEARQKVSPRRRGRRPRPRRGAGAAGGARRDSRDRCAVSRGTSKRQGAPVAL